ncbi:MAG: chemotaxis protein CheB [Nitrospinaceae bacterium]
MGTAQKRVLVAEDESKSFELIKRVLGAQGWTVDSALDGKQALERLKREPYQVLLTDLNMPVMNGMELISRTRTELPKPPLIIMFSAYANHEVQTRAKAMGVYAILPKPVDFKKLAQAFHEGLTQWKRSASAPAPSKLTADPKSDEGVHPSNPIVVLAVSTCGPEALKTFFGPWVSTLGAPVLTVLHSPQWAIKNLVENFNKEFGGEEIFRIARKGETPQPNHVYFAPGNWHLILENPGAVMGLNQGPLENFVRPAADSLFRSAAAVFGDYCIGVVLTGLGKDAAAGSETIEKNGGTVFIQDPKAAIAPFMPKATMAVTRKPRVLPLEEIPSPLCHTILKMKKTLELQSQKVAL